MSTIPDEINVLLRRAYLDDPNANSPLRQLAAAVEAYFDDEEEILADRVDQLEVGALRGWAQALFAVEERTKSKTSRTAMLSSIEELWSYEPDPAYDAAADHSNFTHSSVLERLRKPARRSQPLPQAVSPGLVAKTKGGKHQRAVVEYLRTVGGRAARKDVHAHLIKTGAPTTGPYRILKDMVTSGFIEEVGDGVVGLPTP